MVKINKEEMRVTVEIERTQPEEIVEMQLAIIDLISNYDYNDFGNSCGLTIVYACNLLKALLPDADQQEIAFGTNRGWVKIPDTLSSEKRRDLINAVKMISAGEKDLTDNKVYQALTKASRT